MNEISLANLIPIQPGHTLNPYGNRGWSTKPISSRIEELLNGDCSEWTLDNPNFKTKKAKDALAQAILEKAINGDVAAMRLTLESIEGKATQQINVTKTNKIDDASLDRLNESLDKIRKKTIDITPVKS